ncbi:hypothetical protein [Microvirga solisilvae]|uniref:hypothetical protein n=1 Tax=Microvirga solisilvae TaxID=2919498 RepID=UPI001FB00B92|nr:hypothetical protein [Microvirga solisilvae]
MAQNQNSGPRASNERPVPKDAARNPRSGSQDRPGPSSPLSQGNEGDTGPKTGGVTDGTNGPA